MKERRSLTSFCLCVALFVVFVDIVQTMTDDIIQRQTACVGRCNYKYSLQCPPNQKIAIQNLEYGAKEVTDTCPDRQEPCQKNHEACCKYYAGDCLMSFSDIKAYPLYQKCSAAQQCGWLNAESIDMRSRCMFRGTSNYVATSYKCVDDSSFVDICSNEHRRGKTFNIIYRGDDYKNQTSPNSGLCSCLVSTSNCKSLARLRFKTVDIRLQKQNNLHSCHMDSRFLITDSKGHRNFSCNTNHFYRGYYDLYYSIPDHPYAKISLYNMKGQFPSFFWLEISATLPDVDIVVSCGSAKKNRSFCGPAELLPSTKIHEGRQPEPTPEDVFTDGSGKKNSNPPDTLGSSEGSSGENSDLKMIIIAVVSAIVLVTIIIVVVVCVCKRRRPKEKKPKTLPPIVYPPPPPYHSDDSGGEYGNYYETMGTLEACNGRHMSLRENKGSFSPGPYSSAPVSPFGKSLETPVTVKPIEAVDANPYNAPWDTKPLPTPNRAKKEDLAYAASDEIQVLIQRMESDRRRLNEGSVSQEDTPKTKSGYIHINDYKFEDTPSFDRRKLDDEETEEIHSVDDVKGDEIDDNVNMNCINPLENSVTDKSEDTGYRSVGSAVGTPDQILVSEDDYLVPGSARSTLSSQRSISKSDSNHNTDRMDSVQVDNDDVFGSNECKTEF